MRYALRGDPEHPFSEAIGVVMHVERDERDDEVLSIMKRSGDVVRILSKDVLASKTFPS